MVRVAVACARPLRVACAGLCEASRPMGLIVFRACVMRASCVRVCVRRASCMCIACMSIGPVRWAREVESVCVLAVPCVVVQKTSQTLSSLTRCGRRSTFNALLADAGCRR